MKKTKLRSEACRPGCLLQIAGAVRRAFFANRAVLLPNVLLLAATLAIGLSQVFGVSYVRASFQRNRAQIEYPRRETAAAPCPKFVTTAAFQKFPGAPSASQSRVEQTPLTELTTDVEPLRTDFNRNASSTRLLLILSPS